MSATRTAATASLVLLVACTRGDSGGYSGTVQSESAAVGSTLGGRVVAVRVREGDAVGAGQVLVTLDGSVETAAYRAALEQARAADAAVTDLEAGTRAPDLDRARDQARQAETAYEAARRSTATQLGALDDQVRQSEAAVASARAADRDAQADAHRTRALYATGDLSAQQRDAANARAGQTRAALKSAVAAASAARQARASGDATIPRTAAGAFEAWQAALAAYRSLAVGPRPGAVAQARASAAAARSNARSLQARLDQLVVRAPAAGTISALDLHPGDVVAPGAAVATVDESGEPYVRVFVPQSRLDVWHVGDAVSVRSDAAPDATISGTIEAIDARAQFTPQNVQTAEDRATLTFGVKVRIHARSERIHAGTTATVTHP